MNIIKPPGVDSSADLRRGFKRQNSLKFSASPSQDLPGSSFNRGNSSEIWSGEKLDGAKAEKEAQYSLDSYSLESLIELKISRFLEQIGDYYPADLHAMFLQKIERPLLKQILQRTGGNQVHAARILGINRNTLRKKIKVYGL